MLALLLGIPFAAGNPTRRTLRARKGDEWYEGVFLPRIGPLALVSVALWFKRRWFDRDTAVATGS